MRKLYFAVSLVALAVAVLVFVNSNKESVNSDVNSDKESAENLLKGGNNPDTCAFYDQEASRSHNDNVKAASGRLFSYRITTTATNLRYFQLHDIATEASTSATVVYSVPLNTTTASGSPVTVEERFVVPMRFNTGITWTLSNAFATWSSLSAADTTKFFVSMCFE